MSSPLLDLVNTEGFRKKLILRNLTPYAKAPNRPSTPIEVVYEQSDSSVQDSPDKFIDEPTYANILFPLNQYGNEGGYRQVPDPGSLNNKKSNEGEYGYQDANIVDQSITRSQEWKPLNVFSNGEQLPLDSAQFFESLNRPPATNTVNNQPYPTTFVYSNYSPISILLSADPTGSNGLLSQDSFIARLGASTLRREFEERIAAQIRQDTLGRANILNVTSGTDVVNILAGIVPIIEPVFTITVTANPILAATNFALRLGGSILPVSPIPGSYFDQNITLGQPTTIQQLSNAFRRSGVGRFFNRLMGGGETGSQIMFNNMGAGQRSRLFKNIDLNRYKPNFPRNFFERVAGVLVGTVSDNSNFYVGNITSNPSKIFSPAGEVPVNQFGVEQQSPVYGPSELAQLYEGPSQSIRLGANGPTYGNGGGIEGGFTWVSPKYRGNAGKKVGIGGQITNQDEDFRPSSYVDTESVGIPLKEGSILDNTQRLIDSQPQGGRRLEHVGNAIDQVSKVFSDGYKEMTKGSRVLSYVGAIGQEVGTEYCRVFAKDVPYLQYNDLQKQDGITTEGRRFSYSVLDKTYNLNIVPNKQEGGQSSTNIVGPINTAVAKKYMFSLENLAWKTSNTPGFSTSDLAVCERGPNGGRVMWFPPYDLTFTENILANWNPNDFLGRPEPIYTYKNTSRGGTISWKIVVDHPSVLNVIVNKVLSNETNKTRINSILDSFFAGCRKYDVYELAKLYTQINPNDLYELQTEINTKQLTREQIQYTRQTIQTGNNSPGDGVSTQVTQSGGGGNTDELFNKYINFGLYFDNDQPQGDVPINYTIEYDRYVNRMNTTYNTKTNELSTPEQTKEFFDTVVTPNYEVIKGLAIELGKQLSENPEGSVTILITSSCSAAATTTYNDALSQRRIDSMVQFFIESEFTKSFINSRLFVKGSPLDRVSDERAGALGERTKSTPQTSKTKTAPFVASEFIPGKIVNCTDEDRSVVGGDILVTSKEVFTIGAMACRRAYISSVTSTLTAPDTITTTSQGIPISNTPPPTVLVGNKIFTTEPVVVTSQEWKPKDNITKKVVRALLSECDYFESIKETTPMVYDNLKDKLKYFHPVFHSMTPEGLNTRLTFLQQCMRPGDTIKTPFSQTVDASNTSFGAPPVLILRVGDFYNTKIIPNSLSLSYEGLDLNPEGIGVQPMIATVSLQFNFVGGSGLKESVDKLQNALTFNYYANTEIYDDRADATDLDSSLVLDQIFLQGTQPPPIPGANAVVPNNGQDNNNTIGNIISSTVDIGGVTTGIISYREFMNKVVAETQTYFTDVVNKTKESVTQYNNAVRQQWLLERNYTQGNLNVNDGNVILFGKSSNVEKRFDEIFAELNKNIKDGTEGFIQYLSGSSNNLPSSVIRVIQQNYGNFVSRKRTSFENGISTITQSLVNQQQIYIRDLARLNTITLDGQTGTDGFQAKNGPVIIYITSGTNDVPPNSTGSNTYDILKQDINTIKEDIAKFNDVIFSEKEFRLPNSNADYKGILVFGTNNGKANEVSVNEVFLPFSKNPLFANNVVSFPFRRVYMTISDEVIDGQKYESFKQQLIGNVIGNQAVLKGSLVDIDALFNTYWLDTARPAFLEENNITKFFIEDLEKNELKDYLIYTPPFDDKNQRNFTFTSVNPATETEKKSQENMIKGLANTTNQNTNVLTWNDSLGEIEAYISKAKFN